MENSGELTRSASDGDQSTYISPGLKANLLMAAIRNACRFYSDFFNKPISDFNYPVLLDEYKQVLAYGRSFGLFKEGGIHEKDHLNLWCLAQVLSPEIYIESGVFIGSSLHAFIESRNIKRIIAIDPDLSMLKIPQWKIPQAELIDDKDFSQINIDFSGEMTIVYFDDHINTAERIIQAYEKRIRYVLFDDSTGFEGICQRLYPAVPTIPMIMNSGILNPGDEVSWSFNGEIRVSLTITQAMIDKCLKAKDLIKKYARLPDLGEFIPQLHPEKTFDTGKFLVELYSH